MPTLEKTKPVAVRHGASGSLLAFRHPAPSGEDRRITRSRAALREALIELMGECGFEAVTVNDLCARAGLTRGTFYNHYQDKEALLAAFEEEVLRDLEFFERRMGDLSMANVLYHIARKQPLPALVEIFDYLRTQGDFLHAVLGPGGDVRFAPRLRDTLCTQIVESILHEQYRDNPTPFVGYYVAFFASAYLGVITRWIETGMAETSQEMALISQRLLFIKPGESIKL
ncbi:MAG: TetR/AcrR family transcriptional regulator [Coriobacteriia bacterium]|nr:TetR/AcrR family transcriptional regulator [Coriobacteriia bacterium]